MWKNLKVIYGGDKNIQKAKDEILRGNFDDMRMYDGHDIETYGKKVKDVMLYSRDDGGTLYENECVRKILRTLIPKCAIRVSTIQKIRQ